MENTAALARHHRMDSASGRLFAMTARLSAPGLPNRLARDHLCPGRPGCAYFAKITLLSQAFSHMIGAILHKPSRSCVALDAVSIWCTAVSSSEAGLARGRQRDVLVIQHQPDADARADHRCQDHQQRAHGAGCADGTLGGGCRRRRACSRCERLRRLSSLQVISHLTRARCLRGRP